MLLTPESILLFCNNRHRDNWLNRVRDYALYEAPDLSISPERLGKTKS